ncbi:radical SAM protein [Solirubrobacter sp. CPCC 204708]|uniref:Radical SAM protein n=1 Tax=Solirubrobacter deserti TaxID=2282478 RepID=A0ABT4RNY8_9ACTN|nr:radical SAM protein [Solirubrobacter deserti]MBE2318352.1 radical SAM protein [Solirubrobacter deserti]MDA0140128.1 radical SAM protein [Solirubrobacter deserti]
MTFTALELLKLRLLADGVRLGEDAAAAWHERFEGPLTLAEYATTSGISVALPGELYVNAPLSAGEALPQLRYDEGFVIVADGEVVPVEVVPVPSFHTRTQTDGYDGTVQPYTNYGVTHTDRCRVSPIGGCAWKCKFCDLPYEWGYRKKHPENLLNVILAAQDDPQAPARHVLVSGGTPRAPVPARPGRPAQDDEAWIDDVFAYLAEHSPLPVDVMLPPRRDLAHAEKLRRMGINMLSVNLEVSDPERTKVLAPAKAKVGREHTLNYIERAVEAFDVGFVQSLVVFGAAIEPLESTLRGVRDLAQRGCIPVLSPFRPHHLTPLADAPPASFEEIVEVLARSIEICEQAGTGVLPGPRCVACHHNTATLPDGSEFYAGAQDDLTARPCPVS